ncbi:response regulator transcription factor [bacterium]|nr:response regulator transcription factor [bacterium]
MKQTVLVIDDDEKLNDLLEDYLAKYGFEVISSTHPIEGLELIRSKAPDLVILDVMLPEMDGFEVCKKIRQDSSIPIIMLTARGEITDKVVGLELGADDYLPKPFEPRELVARIQSVLRRSGNISNSPLLVFNDLTVNLENHEVRIKEEIIDLTSTEFELLTLFVKHPGKVLNRDQIMEWVSGIEWESFNRSVDVLVSRLRQKLKDDPKHPVYLKTIWGTGYLFLGKPEQ